METLKDPTKRRFFQGKVRQPQVIRLPWIISESVFTQNCTQCQDCINACDTKIIIQDQQGFPKIDFSQGKCSFCQKCIDSCKQALFLPTANIGNSQKAWPIAFTISEKCFAKNNIYCQSCKDECEENAITFNYLDSSIPQPNIMIEDCTQCGACVANCPQQAITFQLNITTD